MPTNRDWIKAVMAGRTLSAVPFNFMFSPPAREKLERYYHTDNIVEWLNFPIAMNAPKSIKAFYADPDIYGPTMKDEFGVTWSNNKIDRGSPIGPCLPEPNLAGYRFPDPAASERFEHLNQWSREHQDDYTVLWAGDFWERVTFMRGMQEALEDLILHPEFIEQLLDRLTESILQTMATFFQCCPCDAIGISDDYGVQ